MIRNRLGDAAQTPVLMTASSTGGRQKKCWRRRAATVISPASIASRRTSPHAKFIELAELARGDQREGAADARRGHGRGVPGR